MFRLPIFADVYMLALPPVTRNIIVACSVVYFLQSTSGLPIDELFALWPLGPNFQAWQLVTYAFLHANLTHLLFNMFGLWMFGSEIERLWGGRRYTQYLLVSTLSAGALQLLLVWGTQMQHPTVGASGGIFGLLLAFAVMFPHRKIIPLFPPIPMPAWLAVTIFGLIELFEGVTGTLAGVAHFAHLGGMLGGALMLNYWRGGRR